jgi:hypothetical protein
MLTLLSKNPVKFVVSDQLAETAVVLSPDDDEEALASKLQRVLELVGYANYPQRVVQPMAFQAPAEPRFTPADRAAQDARLAGVTINGWNEDAVDGVDQLPEV